jgi:hypothetical protein
MRRWRGNRITHSELFFVEGTARDSAAGSHLAFLQCREVWLERGFLQWGVNLPNSKLTHYRLTTARMRVIARLADEG